MLNRHLFIVCEGLSGAGKTKFAKALSKKIGAYYFKTPSPPLNKIRDWIDTRFDFNERYFFYLTSIFVASERIKQILKKRSVICDRYIYTTLAFHAALGVKIHNLKDLNCIVIPDIVFLIDCDEHVRLSRLKFRGMTFNDKMEQKLKTDKNFLTEYKKFSMIKLNNNDSIDKTLKEALFFIYKKNVAKRRNKLH